MKCFKIKSIKAREILDSRGNPTVEVDLITDNGLFRDSVPSGASKGKYEALELRDERKRYSGKGVLRAVKNVNNIIAPKLKGKDTRKQKDIDDLMLKLDGTENKSKLGANAILGISMVCCRAGASAENLPLYKYIENLFKNSGYNVNRTIVKNALPSPCFNIINGGVHSGNDLDFQEFMITPQFKKFSKNLETATEIYYELKKILKKEFGGMAINIGDEGGFSPMFNSAEQALDSISRAVENLGFSKNIKIVIDVAASQFYLNGKYKTKTGVFTRNGLLNYYFDLIKKYPILGLEDGFDENDWNGFQELTKKFNKKINIIGDDILSTNIKRMKIAKEKSACNAMILKPNQVGTILEALEAAKLAKSYKWKILVSHRSGDTPDSFIADLAIGVGADFIKSGAPARGERVAK
ncbi:MAG: phosphopyruvate hydratase [Patescibacteria group bacterium]|nr:phosphopyruvate hydratase [Patescibacteria group bacterium]